LHTSPATNSSRTLAALAGKAPDEGFSWSQAVRKDFTKVSRIHAQVALDGRESDPFEAVLIQERSL
jgi:hypothetical protein